MGSSLARAGVVRCPCLGRGDVELGTGAVWELSGFIDAAVVTPDDAWNGLGDGVSGCRRFGGDGTRAAPPLLPGCRIWCALSTVWLSHPGLLGGVPSNPLAGFMLLCANTPSFNDDAAAPSAGDAANPMRGGECVGLRSCGGCIPPVPKMDGERICWKPRRGGPGFFVGVKLLLSGPPPPPPPPPLASTRRACSKMDPSRPVSSCSRTLSWTRSFTLPFHSLAAERSNPSAAEQWSRNTRYDSAFCSPVSRASLSDRSMSWLMCALISSACCASGIDGKSPLMTAADRSAGSGNTQLGTKYNTPLLRRCEHRFTTGEQLALTPTAFLYSAVPNFRRARVACWQLCNGHTHVVLLCQRWLPSGLAPQDSTSISEHDGVCCAK